MNSLPLELETIVGDYVSQLERTEKLKTIHTQLLQHIKEKNKYRTYDYQYFIENECCNCLDIYNTFDYSSMEIDETSKYITDKMLLEDDYRIFEGLTTYIDY